MARVTVEDDDGVVVAVGMLNWTICSAAHSEMYRRSSAAKSRIDAKALLRMMLCGSNAIFVSSEIVNVVNLEQFAKASSPMDVTLSGIVMDVNPAHLLKASLPMDVTQSGIVIDVNASHP